MSRATFDELKQLRRRAKEDGDAEAGLAAAYELVERRGSFEDLCWQAWFERELGRSSAARLTILEALADNPGHPSAQHFLQELEYIETEKARSRPPDPVPCPQPRVEEISHPVAAAEAAPAHETDGDIAALEHQAAAAARRQDWRRLARLAEALLSINREGGYYCWLIRAQIELGLFGAAESNLKHVLQTTPASASLDPTIRKLLSDLRSRVTARRSTNRYIVTSWLPLTEESVWLVMEGPAREIARFKSEEAAQRFLAARSTGE